MGAGQYIMVEVVPAIIPKSFKDLKDNLEQVNGLTDRVQIDILDGRFAPPKSWPFNEASNEFKRFLSEKSKLPYWQDFVFEVDMMVEGPEQHIDNWMHLGVQSFIIHYGSTSIFEDIITKVHKAGDDVGLALRPSTPNDEILKYIGIVDFIQLMGNDKIGYHGVQLDERVYEKVRKLRKRCPDVIMSVDIGVNFETAPKLIEAGVNKLVSGSTIFESSDVKSAIEKLKTAS